MISDDKHNIMSDDEYQLPKDEYVADEAHGDLADDEVVDFDTTEEHSAKPASFVERFPILKNKKFLIGAGIVLVVVIAYPIMRSHDTKNIPLKHPIVESQPVQQVQQPAPQVMGQLDSLKQNQVSDSQTVSDLQDKVNSLDSQLSAANSQNAALSQNITKLSSQVRMLTSVVADNARQLEAAKKAAVHKKVKKPKYVAPPLTFSVRAVVPGRAWVDASNGLSYSVAAGDSLPQVGVVRAVDAADGKVILKSGKVISFGSNDS